MADYNIYIHNATNESGSGSSAVSAWKPEKDNGGQTKAWKKQAEEESQFQTSIGETSEVIAEIGATTSAAKSAPVVAAAVAVIKIAIKIADVVIPFVDRETGDYRTSHDWTNLKSTIQYATDPISSIFNRAKMQQEYRLQNKKVEQERVLLGDAFLNSNVRRN